MDTNSTQAASQKHFNNPQDDIFTWLATTSNEERFDFLRNAFDSVPLEEVKGVQRLIEHSRKRKKNALRLENEKRARVENPPGVPVCSKLPVPSGVEKPWWKAYKKREIVALDTEMVSLLEKRGKKHIVKAATVAVVRMSDREVLYNATIYHEPGSFIVNYDSKRITGFGKYSLKDGRDMEQVKLELDEVLRGKLIITVAGAGDFLALDLPMSDYDVFDLHQHWKKWNGTYTKAGEPNFQPISMKSLYLKYKKIRIQDGVHDAIQDCIYTLELFEVYTSEVKKTDVSSRNHDHNIDDFLDI